MTDHLDMTIRAANKHDAAALVPLVNQAGEGLPLHIWSQMAAEGEDPWDYARTRIAEGDSGISYRNAWVGEVHGQLAGCLIGYRQPSVAEPITEDVPPMFAPLLDLEAEAPDTGYVYILSTTPDMQGQGVGSRLLEFAEQQYAGPKGMSIIVSNGNTGARRLYERHGYQLRTVRKMVKEAWENPGDEWHLLVKPPH